MCEFRPWPFTGERSVTNRLVGGLQANLPSLTKGPGCILQLYLLITDKRHPKTFSQIFSVISELALGNSDTFMCFYHEIQVMFCIELQPQDLISVQSMFGVRFVMLTSMLLSLHPGKNPQDLKQNRNIGKKYINNRQIQSAINCGQKLFIFPSVCTGA